MGHHFSKLHHCLSRQPPAQHSPASQHPQNPRSLDTDNDNDHDHDHDNLKPAPPPLRSFLHLHKLSAMAKAKAKKQAGKPADDGPVSSRTRKAGKKNAVPPPLNPPLSIPPPPPPGPGPAFSVTALPDAFGPPPNLHDDWDPVYASDTSLESMLYQNAVPPVPTSKQLRVPFSFKRRRTDEPAPLSDRERLLQRTLVPAEPTVEPDGDSQDYKLQQLVLPALNRPCPMCKIHLFTNAYEVVQQARIWLEKKRTDPSIPPMSCAHCNKAFCLDCGATQVAWNHKCRDKASSNVDSALATFLIWFVLCALEDHFSDLPKKTTVQATRKRKKLAKKAASTLEPAFEPGTGYGGDQNWNFPGSLGPPPKTAKMIKAEAAHDEILGRAFAHVIQLLPIASAEESSLSILTTFLNIHILESLAELLVNDSLQEVTKHVHLYRKALQLARLLVETEHFRHLVTDERTVPLEDRPLLDSTLTAAKQTSKGKGKRKAVETETRESLASCLQGLSLQCKAMQQSADRDLDAFADKESTEMLNLCVDIEVLMATLPEDVIGRKGSPCISTDSPFEDAWFRDMCVVDVEDDYILNSAGFYHAVSAKEVSHSKPGRMKRLLVEMTTLKTSLPPGIFLRHEMSRPDVLKAIIIGPKETPYAYGAFEFDIFCPATYPEVPPKVQFRTTGGGTEGMNPNLYPDGKVCLSLLGTWQGQPWQPNESTLLQVLLSLQAMVFCAEPYYNEPGWSHSKNEMASLSYNINLYRATTHFAMVEWLEKLAPRDDASETPFAPYKSRSKKPAPKSVAPPSAPSAGLWDDILVHHFSTNAPAIEAQVQAWLATIKKRDDERQKEIENAKKLAAAPATGTLFPPPDPWFTGFHGGSGKTGLEALLPRLQRGLKAVVKMAEERAGRKDKADEVVEVATGTADVAAGDAAAAKRAIKSPVEKARPAGAGGVAEEEDEQDERGGASRKKRRTRR